jgi:hypothetical protein
MPRKRQQPRKPRDILDTPIEYRADLAPLVFGDSTAEAEAEHRRILGEIGKRMHAIAEHYAGDVPEGLERFMMVILRMAQALHPEAFRMVPEGTQTGRGRRARWTGAERKQLLVVMRALVLDQGMSEAKAVDLYRQWFCEKHVSAQTIADEYRRAEEWWRDLQEGRAKLTLVELLALLEADRTSGKNPT